MRKLFLVACIGLFAVAETHLFAQQKPKSIAERATHKQAALIKLSRGPGDRMRANAFCLNDAGDILACCGNGPGEVRIFDGDGKLKHAWDVPIKPEAINTAPDGTVLVAGSGKLFRYTMKGRELKQAESPHAAALKESKEKLRGEAIQQLSRRRSIGTNSLSSRINTYTRIIEMLEKKKEKDQLNEQEERILKALPASLEKLKEQREKSGDSEKSDKNEISEEAIQQQIENMVARKLRVSSISTDGDHVYVAAYAPVGYGFDVWRLDENFENPKTIVTGLRGCCGHMDVQACSSGLYVAENARHRVVHFDADGEQITTWGQRDRKGIDGFTSCCNPMNVCFNKSGDVYTAESSSGRIKRFNAKGDLQEFVGDVELVPGCKNVSIAVSPDNQRVYMLDITRNHIVLMKRVNDETVADSNR